MCFRHRSSGDTGRAGVCAWSGVSSEREEGVCVWCRAAARISPESVAGGLPVLLPGERTVFILRVYRHCSTLSQWVRASAKVSMAFNIAPRVLREEPSAWSGVSSERGGYGGTGARIFPEYVVAHRAKTKGTIRHPYRFRGSHVYGSGEEKGEGGVTSRDPRSPRLPPDLVGGGI